MDQNKRALHPLDIFTPMPWKNKPDFFYCTSESIFFVAIYNTRFHQNNNTCTFLISTYFQTIAAKLQTCISHLFNRVYPWTPLNVSCDVFHIRFSPIAFHFLFISPLQPSSLFSPPFIRLALLFSRFYSQRKAMKKKYEKHPISICKHLLFLALSPPFFWFTIPIYTDIPPVAPWPSYISLLAFTAGASSFLFLLFHLFHVKDDGFTLTMATSASLFFISPPPPPPVATPIYLMDVYWKPSFTLLKQSDNDNNITCTLALSP